MEILRCLSKNRLYTKMLRTHLFSILTIRTPQTLNGEDTAKCTLTINTFTLQNHHQRLFFETSSVTEALRW